MGTWFVEIAGTATGQRVALVLALVSALMHASLGALIKGGHDAILNRGALNVAAGLMALPVALFVVPWPTPGL